MWYYFWGEGLVLGEEMLIFHGVGVRSWFAVKLAVPQNGMLRLVPNIGPHNVL